MFGGFFANIQSAPTLQSLYSYRMTTSSSVYYPNANNSYTSGDAISISVLVKFSNVATTQSLLSTVNSDNEDGYYILYNGSAGVIVVTFRNGSAQRNQINFEFNPIIDTWYNIVFTASGLYPSTDLWNCYVNASPLSSNFLIQQFTGYSTSSRPIELGRRNLSTNYFEGDYNHAIIYNNYQLNSSEVSDIYNSGQPKFNYMPDIISFRARFDNDTWDVANSRFTSIDDYGSDGYTINLAEADKVLSSPY
jgi:hypothetical protein